jgi:hypothetical protein
MILGLFGLLGVLVWVRGRFLAQREAGLDHAGVMRQQAGAGAVPGQAGQVGQDVAAALEREADRREREAIGLPVGWEPPLP